MAILAVISDRPNPTLGTKIAELYPSDNYKINDSQWLVAADVIPQTLAEQLGVRTGEMGKVLVLKASNQGSGWQSRSLWDWLTLKAEKA